MDLNDLPHISITDMNTDEALETLRQIRLSRRTQVTSPSKSSVEKKARTKASVNVDATQAAELLKLLGGI